MKKRMILLALLFGVVSFSKTGVIGTTTQSKNNFSTKVIGVKNEESAVNKAFEEYIGNFKNPENIRQQYTEKNRENSTKKTDEIVGNSVSKSDREGLKKIDNLVTNKTNENIESNKSKREIRQSRYAEKSENLCIEALRAIKKSKFAEAQKYLNDAKLYWAENSSITVLQEKLDEVKREKLQANKSSNTVNQINKSVRISHKKEVKTYTRNNNKNGINIIFSIILIVFCLTIYWITTSLGSSEIQGNQEDTELDNENIISTVGEEKIIPLEPNAIFSVTTNNLYYSGKTDTYLEQTAMVGNSNIGNYTSLVIEKFSKNRYDMLLENGVKNRVFKFKCGVKLKAKGTTLFVENAEDVVSFKNKDIAEENAHIKENKGCFTDFTKVKENN